MTKNEPLLLTLEAIEWREPVPGNSLALVQILADMVEHQFEMMAKECDTEALDKPQAA